MAQPNKNKAGGEKSQPARGKTSSRGPLATFLTWLQAGRPNHHGIMSFQIILAKPRVNGSKIYLT
jgi:hypothetical protein